MKEEHFVLKYKVVAYFQCTSTGLLELFFHNQKCLLYIFAIHDLFASNILNLIVHSSSINENVFEKRHIESTSIFVHFQA